MCIGTTRHSTFDSSARVSLAMAVRTNFCKLRVVIRPMCRGCHCAAVKVSRIRLHPSVFIATNYHRYCTQYNYYRIVCCMEMTKRYYHMDTATARLEMCCAPSRCIICTGLCVAECYIQPWTVAGICSFTPRETRPINTSVETRNIGEQSLIFLILWFFNIK